MTEPRRDEVERIIRDGFADDTAQGVEMETWLVTAGSDGQSSTLVSGFEAMRDEVIRCMWPDMDGGEEANDMRAEMDDPEFWDGDRWSCGWSFEDGYINVQRVLASRLAIQTPVAWEIEVHHLDGNSGSGLTRIAKVAEIWHEQGQTVRPLYAAPSPVGGTKP